MGRKLSKKQLHFPTPKEPGQFRIAKSELEK